MNTKKIVAIALLIALDIVMTRFLSIQTPALRIGFGFLPTAVTGILFGPIFAALAAVLGDLLGFFLFSQGGAYHPGFTITAALTGATYGFFLHKKQDILRISIAVPIVTIFWGLGLNTFWLTQLLGQGYLALLPGRAVSAAVMTAVQIALIKIISHMLKVTKPHLGLDFD